MTPPDPREAIRLRTFATPDVRRALDRLDSPDVLRQLLERRGRMAELGTEGGDVKLDWVDGVQKALDHPDWLRHVAQEAADILGQGIKHVIWAGMGGSVQTVYCLKRMGFLDSPALSIHPLDSTDPAALNRILREIAEHAGLDAAAWRDARARHGLLDATMMVGVSMGMTSEEPITHLEWFDRVLREAGVDDPGAHIQVMTLPGSYLDNFAKPRGSRMVPIQLDGENHTPGRMSAPATRVFLRPVALSLAARGLDAPQVAERLSAILRRAIRLGGPGDLDKPSANPFVHLGALFADLTELEGRNKVLVEVPQGWAGFAPWLEQLVEESLGKGGKGFLIFYGQETPDGLASLALRDDVVVLRISPSNAGAGFIEAPIYTPGVILDVPVDEATEPAGLGELAGVMLGCEYMVATFGYLHGIVFAGQPGVEGYKRYARDLRDAEGPVRVLEPNDLQATDGTVTVDVSGLEAGRLGTASDVAWTAERRGWDPGEPAGLLASLLTLARSGGWFRYLDVTYNGEPTQAARAALREARDRLALRALGMPCKLRTGPSDYHSTEQSEVDGPFELVSIRIVALAHENVEVGTYNDRFLLAQARGTWQAMVEAGRWIALVTVPDTSDASMRALQSLFTRTAELLAAT